MTAFTISTHDILPPHDIQDWDKFDALKEALESGAKINPIVIVSIGSGTHQVISGSHRYWAAADYEGEVSAVELHGPDAQLALDSMDEMDWNDVCALIHSSTSCALVRAALEDQIGN